MGLSKKALKETPIHKMYKDKSESKTVSELQNRINQLEDKIKNLSEIQKLRIATKNEVHFFNVKDITYLKSESNYTKIHFIDGKSILISKTLGYLTEKISNSHFLRIHASYYINGLHLTKYIYSINSVILNHNIYLPVSQELRKK